jgi:hypothetical protein
VSTLDPVVEDGLNDAVTPLGRFEAERVTFPAKPSRPETDITDVIVEPGAMVTILGEA